MKSFGNDDDTWIAYHDFTSFLEHGPNDDEIKATRYSQIDATLAHIQAKLKSLSEKKGKPMDLHRAFDSMDLDGDGFVGEDEFCKALKKFDIEINDYEIEDLFCFFDVDSDMRIDYKEFCSFAMNINRRLMQNVTTRSLKDTVKKTKTQSKPKQRSDADETTGSTKHQRTHNKTTKELPNHIQEIVDTIHSFDTKMDQSFDFKRRFERIEEVEEAMITIDSFNDVLLKFCKKVEKALDRKRHSILDNHQLKDLAKYYSKGHHKQIRYSEFVTALSKVKKKTKTKMNRRKYSSEDSSGYSSSSSSSSSSSYFSNSSSEESEDEEEYMKNMILRVIRHKYNSDTEDLMTLRQLIQAKHPKHHSKSMTSEQLKKFTQRSLGLKFNRDECNNMLKYFTNKKKQFAYHKFTSFVVDKLLNNTSSFNSSKQWKDLSFDTQRVFEKVFHKLVKAAQNKISIRTTLHSFDKSNSGCITKAEFEASLYSAQVIISAEELDMLVAAILVKKKPIKQVNIVRFMDFIHQVHLSSRYNNNQIINKPTEANTTLSISSNTSQWYTRLGTIINERIEQLRCQGKSFLPTFEMFDLKGSGVIRYVEFREACRQLGLPLTDLDCQKIQKAFSNTLKAAGQGESIGSTLVPYRRVFQDMCGITCSSPSSPIKTRTTNNVPEILSNKIDTTTPYHNPVHDTIVYANNNANTGHVLPKDLEIRNTYLTTPPTVAASSWKCKVCYHEQLTISKNGNPPQCDICKSPKPNGKDTILVIQCPLCSFDNKQHAKRCAFCNAHLGLVFEKNNSATNRTNPSSLASLKNPQPSKAIGFQTSSMVNDKDDGWLT